MKAARFSACAAVLALGACGKNPFESDKGKAADDKKDTGLVLAQGLVQGSAQAASDLHQEIASGDRVQERLEAKGEPEVKPEVGVKSIGAPKGDPILSKGGQPKSMAAGAILKRGQSGGAAAGWSAWAAGYAVVEASMAGGYMAGSTGAASAGPSWGLEDTTMWVLGDSSKGYVLAVRTYAFLDSSGGGAPRAGHGLDSTRYRWPHDKNNPAVMSFDRRRDFDGGAVERSLARDEDGDGLLAECKAGSSVKLRRLWTLTRGDSAWKTLVHSDHGQTTAFDKLGAGKALSWSDTAFAAGRMAWWRRVYDRDGDGFVLTAAAGAKVKVGVDNYSDLGGGLFRYGFETAGAGPDGDYLKDADNERLASSAMTVDSAGKDVNKSESGDADGDGFLWSPAAGAVNRMWESTLWHRYPGLKSYKDSAVKVLAGPGGADARVAYYGAVSERTDGTRLSIALKSADGAHPFGPADTALLAETLTFAPGDAEGRDSTVRTATLVPGRLDTDADDLLLGWSAKTYFRSPSLVASRGETFRSAAPMSPGAVALAGSYATEEKRRDGADPKPEDLARTSSRHDFDKAAGTSAWKAVRVRRDGDSSVAQGGRDGAGGAAYASWSGKGFKASGTYDPATGNFQDTVAWSGADGKPAGRRTAKGGLKDGAGSYTAVVTRADGKVRTVAVKAAKGADGRTAWTRTEGTDTSAWTSKGDSASAERTFAKVKVSFRLGRKGGGGYGMAVQGTDGAGAKALEGALEFAGDATGAGSLTEYAGGKAGNPVGFRCEADGAVRLDDKNLP